MTKADVDKEQLVELVTNSKQYPFAPDTFRKIFYEVFGEDFDWFDLFFNKEEYKSFALWYDEDTWYIYSAQFNITICWYKGLGRINQCTNEFLTEEGLRTLFIELRKDYEDKCLSQKIQYIKELQEENTELNDKLNNLSSVAVDFFKENYPEYVTEKGECLSPYWDLFSAGVICDTFELNNKIAELKAYNEKLLNGDIEKHNKIVELQRENKELKERNKVIDEELLIKQKQLTNAISCLYKSLEVLTKLTEGMRHIAYNHPTMHAHREIMQNLRLAEDYEVELGNILSQGNFGRDEIEVELGKNERRI